MAEKTTTNLDLSIQGQEKFEFYALSLTFTLLAASIQTAKFSSPIPDAFEIGGWLCMLISGLLGLSRMEWLPVARKLGHYEDQYSTDISNIKAGLAIGQHEVWNTTENITKPAIEMLEQRQNGLGQIRAKLKAIEKKHSSKYTVQKWAFFLGLVLIFISRAYQPAVAILDTINSRLF